ncbi:hypothetical protein RBA42_24675, partial [Mycobacteroides abscessus subsp. abscessus]|uniref:hypothetical protein n=1 Tax=Mycobacteroides abscessus TaxID=36809 RepID=UPI003CF7AB7E
CRPGAGAALELATLCVGRGWRLRWRGRFLPQFRCWRIWGGRGGRRVYQILVIIDGGWCLR